MEVKPYHIYICNIFFNVFPLLIEYFPFLSDDFACTASIAALLVVEVVVAVVSLVIIIIVLWLWCRSCGNADDKDEELELEPLDRRLVITDLYKSIRACTL